MLVKRWQCSRQSHCTVNIGEISEDHNREGISKGDEKNRIPSSTTYNKAKNIAEDDNYCLTAAIYCSTIATEPTPFPR